MDADECRWMFCIANDANYNINNKNNFNSIYSISLRRNLWKTPPDTKNRWITS